MMNKRILFSIFLMAGSHAWAMDQYAADPLLYIAMTDHLYKEQEDASYEVPLKAVPAIRIVNDLRAHFNGKTLQSSEDLIAVHLCGYLQENSHLQFVPPNVANEIYSMIGQQLPDDALSMQVSAASMYDAIPDESNTFMLEQYVPLIQDLRPLKDDAQSSDGYESGYESDDDAGAGSDTDADTGSDKDEETGNGQPDSKPRVSLLNSQWIKFGGPVVILSAAGYAAWQKYKSRDAENDLEEDAE